MTAWSLMHEHFRTMGVFPGNALQGLYCLHPELSSSSLFYGLFAFSSLFSMRMHGQLDSDPVNQNNVLLSIELWCSLNFIVRNIMDLIGVCLLKKFTIEIIDFIKVFKCGFFFIVSNYFNFVTKNGWNTIWGPTQRRCSCSICIFLFGKDSCLFHRGVPSFWKFKEY